MGDSPRPLDQRLAEWLDTQGYPLEMRVARAFRSSAFRVIQSEFYTDQETGTSREIDVVASLDARQADYLLRLTFVAECKMSRDKPWVLFSGSSRGLADPARVVQRASDSLGDRLLVSLAKNQRVHELDLFALRGQPAHGLTQAFTSGVDAAYAAVHSAAKAAAALARERGGSAVPVLQVVFPLVVIEGRLFEYALGDDDSPRVAEVGEGTLLWRNPVVDEPHTIIDVVTLNKLPEYVARARRSCDAFFPLAESACHSVASAAREPRRRMISRGVNVADPWRQ